MRTKILLASLALSIGTLSAQNYQVPVSEKNEPMMKGKFQPTWNSLENYQVPEWFRNAKFGIWAHWGPQCVEGSGDWMARSMYLEGSAEYKHHVEHYGHPSEIHGSPFYCYYFAGCHESTVYRSITIGIQCQQVSGVIRRRITIQIEVRMVGHVDDGRFIRFCFILYIDGIVICQFHDNGALQIAGRKVS
jgi:hypothetical protein